MKLSKPQQHVVDILKDNKGSYLVRSNSYHWSKIWDYSGKIILEHSVWRDTIESLLRKGVLISFDNMLKYKLNEKVF